MCHSSYRSTVIGVLGTSTAQRTEFMLHNLTLLSSISLDSFWSTVSVIFIIAHRFEKVILAIARCFYVSSGDRGTNLPTNHYVLLVKIRSL